MSNTTILQSDNLGLAFACVIGAAAATCFGAGVVFFPSLVSLANRKLLAASLAFAAGVMTYVSFLDIFHKSMDSFVAAGHDEAWAYLFSTVTFFAGVGLVLLFQWIDEACFQNEETEHQVMEEILLRNEHQQQQRQQHALEEANEKDDHDDDEIEIAVTKEIRPLEVGRADETVPSTIEYVESASMVENVQSAEVSEEEKQALYRMGTKTTIAVSFHNFPEGPATFVGYIADPAIGISLAIAIAFHNIPEGLCVSLPIFYSTGSRWKGFIGMAAASAYCEFWVAFSGGWYSPTP